MKRTPTSILFAMATLLLCSSGQLVAADNDQVVVSKVCDPRMIPQGSSFSGHLGALLAQLVGNTPYTPTYSFKTRWGGGDAPAFGEASCQLSCSAARCEACLSQLSFDIWGICSSALGARVEYPDCWIHYECYHF